MRFIVHDVIGNILRTGQCPDDHLALQPHEGETAIEDVWDGSDDRKHLIIDGERVEFTPDSAPPPTVAVQRAMAYPPIGDQLDALWHAMDDGTLPMVSLFYDPIKLVKINLPKE